MQSPISRMHFLWLIVALYLSGCATNPPQSVLPKPTLKPSEMHALHMKKLANIEQFSIKGRIGVITNPKNFSARLAWQHVPAKDNIDIYSPLGGKVANIVKTPDQVTLTDSKKTFTAVDAETLTKDTLGFMLPLAGLSHWALGKPSDKSIANEVTWDQNGNINKILQDGWTISYKDYAVNDAYILPSKITLTNDQIKIKLVVDSWTETK